MQEQRVCFPHSGRTLWRVKSRVWSVWARSEFNPVPVCSVRGSPSKVKETTFTFTFQLIKIMQSFFCTRPTGGGQVCVCGMGCLLTYRLCWEHSGFMHPAGRWSLSLCHLLSPQGEEPGGNPQCASFQDKSTLLSTETSKIILPILGYSGPWGIK